MHVFLRSSYLLSTHYNIIKCCRHCHQCLKCASCKRMRINHDFMQNKRYLAVSSHRYDFPLSTERGHVSIFDKPASNCSLYGILNSRNFTLSAVRFDSEPLKPSSKIEVTVQELKKQKEEVPAEAPKPVVKKSIKQRIVDELVHYYHGFRLLFIDMKISTVLVWRVLNGKTLSRREYRLLTRTVGDMFRLVPFSVFIIVPFMEFLLPVFIKLFPGMLPSTFQTATEREDKLKQNLKVKLEMAKFLQQTLEEMSAQHKDRNSLMAKEFTLWFQKVRTSGEEVSNEEIIKFSKLFQDDITLDSLSRNQLVALCRVLECQTLGTNNMLRFQLRMKLRSLAADDKMIQKEGVNSLTLAEVQQACRARGMRAYGVSEARLRSQLNQWLDLSLNEKVPPSLLLLSRALMLPETITTSDKLKATISVLPDAIVTQTKAAIGEKEGKIDNKVKLEVIKEEERKVIEERKEQKELKKQIEKAEQEELKKQIEKAEKEILVDKAPIITDEKIIPASAAQMVEKPDDSIPSKDLQVLEDALDTMSKDKKVMVEKVGIEELKEHLAEYKEDVEDLEKAVADMPKPEIRETKAAQRLFKKVNKMIGKMDSVLGELATKEKQLKQDLEKDGADHTKEEILKIDDIMDAIKKIQTVPDEKRLFQIQQVLSKMDDDRDGSIKVEDVLKVIEFIGKENVQLNTKQITEIIDLIDKEEILEVEDKIEKALLKEKETGDGKEPSKAQNLEENDLSPSQEQQIPKAEEVKTSVVTSSSTKPPTKIDTQGTSITPPPYDSIDPKTKDASKRL